MKYLIVRICTFLFSIISILKAQYPISLIYLPQGFVLESLSGEGFNRTTNSTLSNYISANPGLLTDLNTISLGVSYQLESKIKEAWIANFGHQRLCFKFPQAISLVIPFRSFRLALGASQIFNSELDYGIIQGTKIWNNEDGYIDTELIRPTKFENVVKTGASISYNRAIANNKHHISFGFQYNSNHLYYVQDLNTTSVDTLSISKFEIDIVSPSTTYGIVYTINDCILQNIRFGLFIEEEIKFKKYKKRLITKALHIGYIPRKVHMGIKIQLTKGIMLSGNYSNLLWEKVEEMVSDISNGHEYSTNIGFALNKSLVTSFGVYTTNHKINVTDSFFDMDQLRAVYFLVGMQYSQKGFVVDICFADSHNFSDNWRKQSIVKLDLGLKL